MLARTATERVRELRARSVLDLFTGSGILAIAAAQAGAQQVTAVDISRRSVACAWVNARLNGVRVRALHGDLFGPVAGEQFDLIVANPPYLPGAPDPGATRGPARAWEGGPDGRALLDRLCSKAAAHLRDDGERLIVHSSVCDRQRTERLLRAEGFEVDILDAAHGPLGPILMARTESLRRSGVLPHGGLPTEELFVFGARLADEKASAR
jgi:release factor glutamine methyltransferase